MILTLVILNSMAYQSMMENAAVRIKEMNIFKTTNSLVSFTILILNAAPIFQPDDETGQLILYLDPGYLKNSRKQIQST